MIPTSHNNLYIDNLILVDFNNLSKAEIELVRTWRNHPEIRQWMYTDHIISLEEHNSFMKSLKDNNKRKNWIIKDSDHNYIGVISINNLDYINKHGYLGIYANVDSEVIGKGLLLQQALFYAAFSYLNLHTLKLEVVSTNTRAIEYYKKAGFQKEGILKEYIYKDNSWLDVVVMGLINPNH